MFPVISIELLPSVKLHFTFDSAAQWEFTEAINIKAVDMDSLQEIQLIFVS